MENKKDKMKASLEKNLPTISKDRPLKIDKDIKDLSNEFISKGADKLILS